MVRRGDGKNEMVIDSKIKKKNHEEDLVTLEDLKLLNTFTEGKIETIDGEHTYDIEQDTIKNSVDLQSGIKRFDLALNSGPYKMDYTRDGRYLLLSGFKGHFSAFEWQTGKLRFELNLNNDEIRDACWLQDESFFAMAQRKYIYVYDHHGIEVHRLKKSTDPCHLQFLPNHFLLTSASKDGTLRYQDISTGDLVAEWQTKMGPPQSISMNSHTGIIGLAHTGGMVSFWSPTINGPILKMLCHKGPTQAIAFDHSGNEFATAGLDGKVKIWDLRTYKTIETYDTQRPASSIDFSQKGLLTAGYGPHVTVYDPRKSKKIIYLKHMIQGSIVEKTKFCPFEDVLGIGHLKGFSSLLVPGSGEPQFDSNTANPYSNKKQRRERQVRQLLDKLQPETIVMNPDKIGIMIAKKEENEISTKEPIKEKKKKVSKKGKNALPATLEESDQEEKESSPSETNDQNKNPEESEKNFMGKRTRTRRNLADNHDSLSALNRFKNKNI